MEQEPPAQTFVLPMHVTSVRRMGPRHVMQSAKDFIRPQTYSYRHSGEVKTYGLSIRIFTREPWLSRSPFSRGRNHQIMPRILLAAETGVKGVDKPNEPLHENLESSF